MHGLAADVINCVQQSYGHKLDEPHGQPNGGRSKCNYEVKISMGKKAKHV